jgi:hypothetical protein
MLVSAMQRLLLYENVYGFTRLRTYTHIFIPWLGALLVIFVALVFVGQLRRIAPLSFLVGLGFIVSMGILNIDAFIVQRNIARYQNGEQIDVPHLISLSTDTAPGLVAFARSAPPDVQEELLPQLACRLDLLQRQEAERGWQSWTVSHSRAVGALQGLDLLTDYEVKDGEDYGRMAVGPAGEKTQCVYWYGWD